jgi:hypothetical protein
VPGSDHSLSTSMVPKPVLYLLWVLPFTEQRGGKGVTQRVERRPWDSRPFRRRLEDLVQVRVAERLTARRDEAFRQARSRLAAFAAAARDLFEIEAQAQQAASGAEERFRSERQTLADCVAVVGRDLNLPDPPISWIPAADRRRLLERFPQLLNESHADTPTSTAPTRTTVARCTVCQHPQRAVIDADLDNGTSYRDAAARFEVSRSALSRHRSHR